MVDSLKTIMCGALRLEQSRTDWPQKQWGAECQLGKCGEQEHLRHVCLDTPVGCCVRRVQIGRGLFTLPTATQNCQDSNHREPSPLTSLHDV